MTTGVLRLPIGIFQRTLLPSPPSGFQESGMFLSSGPAVHVRPAPVGSSLPRWPEERAAAQAARQASRESGLVGIGLRILGPAIRGRCCAAGTRAKPATARAISVGPPQPGGSSNTWRDDRDGCGEAAFPIVVSTILA